MEEADGRIVLHLQNAIENAGLHNIIVRSSDTDVLVLLVSFFLKLSQKGLKHLWLQYGVGSKQRYISVHQISQTLGDDKSEALRGFHAFSGSDFTSFFVARASVLHGQHGTNLSLMPLRRFPTHKPKLVRSYMRTWRNLP
ncbi:uncharacterized protein LOC126735741 [Anthonomus grandis grandis]|uniref:uncharacterized protein LOC126735741 n=1 Tax=Anthonomus grandis grandis TaxID=2921223 RepID=UPI00216543DB|nr:uncharacterized protein LOC126735741 [Anthonomus grandis grandis]